MTENLFGFCLFCTKQKPLKKRGSVFSYYLNELL